MLILLQTRNVDLNGFLVMKSNTRNVYCLLRIAPVFLDLHKHIGDVKLNTLY